jgi:transcriptional regulator with XRE-family HTH domain
MTQDSLKKLAAEFSKAREDKGMTQAEVAKQAGIGKNRYAIIEQGNAKNITIKTLESIVKVLEIKGKDILPF